MVTRLNGFSNSGLDIDTIVKNMMAAKRIPLDKTSQNKQLLEWKREDYREVNSKLYDFRNNKLGLTGYRASAALVTQSAVVKTSAGAAVDSTSGAIRATATDEANGTEMKVNVNQLATASSWAMNDATKYNVPAVGTTTIKAGMSLAEIMDVKQQLPGNGGISDQNGYTFTISVTQDGNSVNKTFSFSKDMTLSAAMAQITSDASLGVKASFDETSGRFQLTAKQTGSNVSIATSAPNNDTSFLNLMSSQSAAAANVNVGLDVAFSINGTTLSSHSNTVMYNGVAMEFRATTGALNDPASALTVSTTADSSKALETVKSFIKDYNQLLADLNTYTTEERYKDFTPLTSEQRSAMSETDITAWEKKAKSGMLNGDNILRTAVSEMRNTVISKLGDLSAMGITTGSYQENGKLYLDEAKFKAAVESDPQKLSNVLKGQIGQSDSSLFGKLITTMDSAMVKIADRAGTSRFDGSLTATFKPESLMGKQLKEYNKRIIDLTSQLADTENRYYKQFSAMETAMNKYKSQLSQLTGTAG